MLYGKRGECTASSSPSSATPSGSSASGTVREVRSSPDCHKRNGTFDVNKAPGSCSYHSPEHGVRQQSPGSRSAPWVAMATIGFKPRSYPGTPTEFCNVFTLVDGGPRPTRDFVEPIQGSLAVMIDGHGLPRLLRDPGLCCWTPSGSEEGSIGEPRPIIVPGCASGDPGLCC